MSRKRVYIVQLTMSSQNKSQTVQITGEEDKVLLIYQYPKEIRNKIQSLRQKYKYPIYNDTVEFYGLRLIGEDHAQSILNTTREADAELKKIHPDLYAQTRLIPLDMDEVSKGELYGEIMSSIRSKVYEEAFEKINKIVTSDKEIGSRTKKSLKRMLKHLSALNILEDEDIDKRIESIKEKIEREAIDELHEELNAERLLANAHSRFVTITVGSDEQSSDEETPSEYIEVPVPEVPEEDNNESTSDEKEDQETEVESPEEESSSGSLPYHMGRFHGLTVKKEDK